MFLVALLLFIPAMAQRRMYPPWPPQQQAGTWEIQHTEDNRISMTRFYPYGEADRHLTIVPGADLSPPESGTFRASGESEQKMTREELSFFWAHAGAQEAWWRYLRDEGKLHLLKTAAGTPVPHRWFDRVVACVTANGRFFIGRLRATPGSDRWIALQIEGAVDPVVFYLDFVEELYTIR
jgi:hypothetical protein